MAPLALLLVAVMVVTVFVTVVFVPVMAVLRRAIVTSSVSIPPALSLVSLVPATVAVVFRWVLVQGGRRSGR
jgi:hypothetical protein